MFDKLTLFAVLSAAVSPSADDPLASLPKERIDLELADAPVRDVMKLVQDISGQPVTLDDCVEGTLSLKLDAVTLRSLLVVIGDTLSLTYARSEDGALLVGCDEPRPDRKHARVDMAVVAVPLSDVLGTLSDAADMPITASGCEDVLVDVSTSNAPVSAVLHTIASQASATVERDGNALQIRC
ncbi:MAG: hypothetical protein ACE37F_16265 [Nannocystaceae bacterium]|nr:hypothetical protein [bacterium]